jgi:ATP-dependent helicase/nuclease subunit B
VRVLREHELRGTFRPVGLEISFGLQGQLPGLQINLRDGTVIILQGRIDRVDSALGEEGYYIRIIDFKSGQPTLSLMEIFYGLKLQLLAYLDVVMRYSFRLIEAEARPGGVLYFKIRDPIIAGEGPLEQDEIEERILRELKMNGYLLKDSQAVMLMDQEINGHSQLVPAAMKKDGEFYKNSTQLLSEEEFKHLQEYVEKVLQEIGEEIISGNVRISPYRYKGKSPCRFCAYRSVCRFDPGVSGQEYRNLPERELSEVWYEIGRKREDKANGQLD